MTRTPTDCGPTGSSAAAVTTDEGIEFTDDDGTDGSADAGADGRTVALDAALVALVDLSVETDVLDVDSREECIDVALREALAPVIEGDHSRIDRPITTDRYLLGEADPVLDELLRLTVQTDPTVDGVESFVRSALFDALDVESGTTEVTVETYDRYAFVIDRLLAAPDCRHETPEEVVHAAVECLFGVHSTDATTGPGFSDLEE